MMDTKEQRLLSSVAPSGVDNAGNVAVGMLKERGSVDFDGATPGSGRGSEDSAADKPVNAIDIAMAATGSHNFDSVSDRGGSRRGVSRVSMPPVKCDPANGAEKPMRCLSAYNLFYQFARDKIVGGEADFDFRTLTPEMVDESANRSIGRKRNWRKHRVSHGKMGFADLAKAIASWWRGLDPAVKALFKARAQIEKERYVDALDEWKRATGGEAKAERVRNNRRKDRSPCEKAAKAPAFSDPFPSPDQASKPKSCVQSDESVSKLEPTDDSPGISPIQFEPFVLRSNDPLSPGDHQHSHSFPTQQLLPVRLSMPDLSLGSTEMLQYNSQGGLLTCVPPIVTPSFERPSELSQSMIPGLNHFFPSHASHILPCDERTSFFSARDCIHPPIVSAEGSTSTVFYTRLDPYQMHSGNCQGPIGQPHLHSLGQYSSVHPMSVTSQHPWHFPESPVRVPVQRVHLPRETTTSYLSSPPPPSGSDQLFRTGSVVRYF